MKKKSIPAAFKLEGRTILSGGGGRPLPTLIGDMFPKKLSFFTPSEILLYIPNFVFISNVFAVFLIIFEKKSTKLTRIYSNIREKKIKNTNEYYSRISGIRGNSNIYIV